MSSEAAEHDIHPSGGNGESTPTIDSAIENDAEFKILEGAVRKMPPVDREQLYEVLQRLSQSDDAKPRSGDLMASLAEMGSAIGIIAGFLLWMLGFSAGGTLIAGSTPGLAATVNSTPEYLEKKNRAKKLGALMRVIESMRLEDAAKTEERQ